MRTSYLKAPLPGLGQTQKAVGVEVVGVGRGVLPALRRPGLQVGDAAQQAVQEWNYL